MVNYNKDLKSGLAFLRFGGSQIHELKQTLEEKSQNQKLVRKVVDENSQRMITSAENQNEIQKLNQENQNRIDQFEKEMTKSRNHFDQVKKENFQLKKELEKLKQNKRDNRYFRKEIQSQIEVVQKENINIKKSFQSQIEQLKNHIEQLKREKSILKKENQNLMNNKDAENEINNLCDVFKQKMTETRQKIEAYKQQIEDLNSQLYESRHQIKELENLNFKIKENRELNDTKKNLRTGFVVNEVREISYIKSGTDSDFLTQLNVLQDQVENLENVFQRYTRG